MRLENLAIILISNEPWGDMWYSKHHYANELSKKNKVYFLDPPQSWKPGNLFKRKIEVRTVAPNIDLISYNNYLPLTVRSSLLHAINNRMVSRMLKTFFREHETHPSLFWSFDPFRLDKPALLGAKWSLYYAMDRYINPTELSLSRNVDIVLAVASALAEKLRVHNSNTVIVPHGIPADMITESNINADREKTIVLTGTLSSRTDFELVDLLAESFPVHHFMLIGKLGESQFSAHDTQMVGRLKQRKNVTFTGVKPFIGLKKDVAKARLALSCYKQDYVGNRLSSLRILQYLACGTEVLTTPFEEYDNDMAHKVISTARTHAEFIEKARHILSQPDSEDRQKERMQYASGFTYQSLIENIRIHLEQAVKQKHE